MDGWADGRAGVSEGWEVEGASGRIDTLDVMFNIEH
jgi:hypothetical protein